MVIDSDFRDYYDDALAAVTEGMPAAAVLTRRRDVGLSRVGSFARLEAMGWSTVQHGWVAQLCPMLAPEHHVVVYRDQLAHGVMPDGTDPLVCVSRDEALRNWRSSYCSFYAFNADNDGRVLGFTRLAVGSRTFVIATRQRDRFGTSPHAWASNRGAYDVLDVREIPMIWRRAAAPLWSVDYVFAAPRPGAPPERRAIDFNTAPVLGALAMEHVLDAGTVARLIVEAMHNDGTDDRGTDGRGTIADDAKHPVTLTSGDTPHE